MRGPSRIGFAGRAFANFLMLAEQLVGPRIFAMLLGRPRALLYRYFANALNGLEDLSPMSVDSREDLSAEEFLNLYFKRGKPVVFKGAAREWPCCMKWSLDHFHNQYAKSDLLLVDAKGLTTREDKSGYEFLSVRDLIQDIRGGGDRYLRFSPLLHENPELTKDLDLNWLRSLRPARTFGNTYYMFMGGAGKKTLLHADQPCNLYVQVTGEKKWTMFYPEDSVCLYPEVTNTAYVKSPIDIDRPDLARFPLYRHARKLEVVLKPGDVMYVPPHVWHQVENLSDSIAVGYRFSSLKAALGSSLTFSLVRILSTDPPVWKTRRYGSVDTNLIWAHTNGALEPVFNEKVRRLKNAAGMNETRAD